MSIWFVASTLINTDITTMRNTFCADFEGSMTSNIFADFFKQTWEHFNREAWYSAIRMSHINGKYLHLSLFEDKNYIKENKLSIVNYSDIIIRNGFYEE